MADDTISSSYSQRLITHLIPCALTFGLLLISVIWDVGINADFRFYFTILVPLLIIPIIGAFFSKARHFFTAAAIVFILSILITILAVGNDPYAAIGGVFILAMGVILTILISAQYGIYRMATNYEWQLRLYWHWLVLIGISIPLIIFYLVYV